MATLVICEHSMRYKKCHCVRRLAMAYNLDNLFFKVVPPCREKWEIKNSKTLFFCPWLSEDYDVPKVLFVDKHFYNTVKNKLIYFFSIRKSKDISVCRTPRPSKTWGSAWSAIYKRVGNTITMDVKASAQVAETFSVVQVFHTLFYEHLFCTKVFLQLLCAYSLGL